MLRQFAVAGRAILLIRWTTDFQGEVIQVLNIYPRCRTSKHMGVGSFFLSSLHRETQSHTKYGQLRAS